MKLYIVAQVVPVLYYPIILLIYPSRYTETKNLWYTLTLFLIARICEFQDKLIYKLTLKTIGGHVLKHIFASVAILFIFRYVRTRKPIGYEKYYYEIWPIRKVIEFFCRI